MQAPVVLFLRLLGQMPNIVEGYTLYYFDLGLGHPGRGVAKRCRARNQLETSILLPFQYLGR